MGLIRAGPYGYGSRGQAPTHRVRCSKKAQKRWNPVQQRAAEWFRYTSESVQTSFMNHFGGTANIRNKLFYVIAEFVPTTFDAGATYAHAIVEADHGIMEGGIAFSKYIKPPHLCTPNQKVTHVTLGFVYRDDANGAIRNGLIIEGKHVTIRKTLTEPRRCLKCQGYGHYAPDCKAEKDTCTRCAAHHRTAQCDHKDASSLACANCKGQEAKGHGSADRNCLSFKAERENIARRTPENKYKYYPTNDPHSWKLLNEQNSHNETQQQADHRHQQRFMHDWQEMRHPCRRQLNPPVNPSVPDNGWPTRPAQTTLDQFGYNATAQGPNAPHQWYNENNQGRQNDAWADRDPRDPREQGPGQENALPRKSLTPLEYA